MESCDLDKLKLPTPDRMTRSLVESHIGVEAESCAGVLGFVLRIGLCKLGVDRLPKG